jgi:polysaccharide export outer membrane protein
MRLISNLTWCAILLFILNSCAFKKKIIYFQDGQRKEAEANRNYTPILRSDDLLFITVIGIDQEAVKPFNLPLSLQYNNAGGYAQGASTPPGFLIDAEGNIDFPVIGKIRLSGLNRVEATSLLKEKLQPYLLNPVVNIRILNFKITVLGEVKNPGTFTIPNERITLLEALGIAGDLNITAVRKNVLVIRDDNGKKMEFRVDLTSKELFTSPVYYLNQNDVVYVEPNRARVNSSAINPSNAGIIISAVSLIVSVLVLLSR